MFLTDDQVDFIQEAFDYGALFDVGDDWDALKNKTIKDICEEYADNAFTDLHEHADEEIKEAFASDVSHARTMRMCDELTGSTFVSDFRTMHADILK